MAIVPGDSSFLRSLREREADAKAMVAAARARGDTITEAKAQELLMDWRRLIEACEANVRRG